MSPATELSRPEQFFEGQEIVYDAIDGSLNVKVTMRDAGFRLRKNGTDAGYDYKGRISVKNYLRANSGVEWNCDDFRLSSTGFLGELFHGLAERADGLSQVLSLGNAEVDRATGDSLASCLFKIKERVTEEFLQAKNDLSNLKPDLYDKYFRPHMRRKSLNVA